MKGFKVIVLIFTLSIQAIVHGQSIDNRLCEAIEKMRDMATGKVSIDVVIAEFSSQLREKLLAKKYPEVFVKGLITSFADSLKETFTQLATPSFQEYVTKYIEPASVTYKAVCEYSKKHDNDPVITCTKCKKTISYKDFWEMLGENTVKQIVEGSDQFDEINKIFNEFTMLLAAEAPASIAMYMIKTLQSSGRFSSFCQNCNNSQWGYSEQNV